MYFTPGGIEKSSAFASTCIATITSSSGSVGGQDAYIGTHPSGKFPADTTLTIDFRETASLDYYTSITAIGVPTDDKNPDPGKLVMAHFVALDGSGAFQDVNVTSKWNSSTQSFEIKAPDNYYIDYVTVTGVSGKLGISSISTSINTVTTDDDILTGLKVSFTAHDSDGDSVTGALALTPQMGSDIDMHEYKGEHGLVLAGGDVDSTIIGTDNNDIIYAGGGNNLLYGGAGDDIIYGGAGDDTIYGGTGNNILFGGGGDNTFAWKLDDMDHGKDSIQDFDAGDKLLFEDLISDAGEMQAWLDSAKWAVIKDDDGIMRTINYGNAAMNLQLKHETGLDFAELTVNKDGMTLQTIEIHGWISDQMHSATDDQVIAMIQAIIKVGGGIA